MTPVGEGRKEHARRESVGGYQHHGQRHALTWSAPRTDPGASKCSSPSGVVFLLSGGRNSVLGGVVLLFSPDLSSHIISDLFLLKGSFISHFRLRGLTVQLVGFIQTHFQSHTLTDVCAPLPGPPPTPAARSSSSFSGSLGAWRSIPELLQAPRSVLSVSL